MFCQVEKKCFYMKRLNIPTETMTSICQDYKNGMRGTRLAKKYKYSPGKMYKSLREVGVAVRDTSHRLYNIDETMFECIDCEFKIRKNKYTPLVLIYRACYFYIVCCSFFFCVAHPRLASFDQ